MYSYALKLLNIKLYVIFMCCHLLQWYEILLQWYDNNGMINLLLLFWESVLYNAHFV